MPSLPAQAARPVLVAAAPRCRRRSCRRVAAYAQADSILRSISENGEVAVLVCSATALIEKTSKLHSTLPVATAALGRAMIGAVLLSAYREEGEVTTLLFQGSGPLGKVIAVADSQGRAKGLVTNGAVDLPVRKDGKIDVGHGVGKSGTLTVTRALPQQKEPVRGVVPLTSGEIAEDIAGYLMSSEQIGAAIGLGVLVAPDLSVEAAGGYFVQVLPFASDDTLTALEENIRGMEPVTTLLKKGHTPAEITAMLLGRIGVSPGAVECPPPSYGPCVDEDIRARMERACVSLGSKELQAIISEQAKLELRDDLCGCVLQLDTSKVLAMALEAETARA